MSASNSTTSQKILGLLQKKIGLVQKYNTQKVKFETKKVRLQKADRKSRRTDDVVIVTAFYCMSCGGVHSWVYKCRNNPSVNKKMIHFSLDNVVH